MQYDITIIGAGIVGLSTAYKLLSKKPDLKILVLEKEPGVAMHQTGSNSGVIHSGIYYRPDSLRAKYCIEGYRQLLDFSDNKKCAIRCIALDMSDEKIYFTDFGEGKIQKADLSPGSTVEDVVTGLAGPVGIAVVTQTSSSARSGKSGSFVITWNGFGVHNDNTLYLYSAILSRKPFQKFKSHMFPIFFWAASPVSS